MTRADLRERIRTLWNDEAAPTAAEYAILLAGIAIAIIASVRIFGEAVDGLFAQVVAKWP